MAQRSELIFSLVCPRCGQNHDDLEFDQMDSPVHIQILTVLEHDVSVVALPYWAMCPVNAEPILARIVGDGEVEVR